MNSAAHPFGKPSEQPCETQQDSASRHATTDTPKSHPVSTSSPSCGLFNCTPHLGPPPSLPQLYHFTGTHPRLFASIAPQARTHPRLFASIVPQARTDPQLFQSIVPQGRHSSAAFLNPLYRRQGLIRSFLHPLYRREGTHQQPLAPTKTEQGRGWGAHPGRGCGSSAEGRGPCRAVAAARCLCWPRLRRCWRPAGPPAPAR